MFQSSFIIDQRPIDPSSNMLLFLCNCLNFYYRPTGSLIDYEYHAFYSVGPNRVRILGCNWDKSPCYNSQSPLLTNPPPPPSKSGLKLVCIVWYSETSTLRRLCPETSTKLHVHELGFSALLI